MSDDDLDPGATEDLGEPIEQLSGYQEQVSAGFMGRVLRTLGRRSLGSQFATLGWTAMGEVLLEFLKAIYSLFTSGRSDQGE